MSQIGAKHILVDHEYEAKDILKKLADGDVFEDLAKYYSNCSSSRHGGDLGMFSKGQMVKPFEEAVFKLEVDQVSEIIRTQFGYHIIKRTA